MRVFVLVTFIWTLLLSGTAFAKPILLIPLDNRPVCNEYVVDTISKAGFEIKTPPATIIPGVRRQLGDTAAMLKWLQQEAPKAKAVVMSTDALIYGGLVGSRTHLMSDAELSNRVKQILDVINNIPNVKIYAYSTIMRTPKTNTGATEPIYYATYGEQIFRHSQLQDMHETIGLNKEETKEFEELELHIPTDVLNDWQGRRAKNRKVNELLMKAVKNGKFSYFILGKDDTAQFSASHRDARLLAPYGKELPRHKYSNFVGADQLGMVLCMRAIADSVNKMPYIYTHYNEGVGANTIPTYEDVRVGDTVKEHIWALGGYPTNFLDQADMILMVNTPISGKTPESAATVNNEHNMINKPHEFLQTGNQYIRNGYPVAIGDIAYGNGGDNALVQAIFDSGMEYRLAAYAGWNTASNTLGYALVQGLLSNNMSIENKRQLLLVRYTDDWGYQANVRGNIYNSVIYPQGLNGQDLGESTAAVQTQVQTALRAFMAKHLTALYFNKTADTITPHTDDTVATYANKIEVRLPWGRMFEVHVKIKK